MKNDRKTSQPRPSRLANEVDPGYKCTNLRLSRDAGESGDITDKGKKTTREKEGVKEREEGEKKNK